MRVVLPNTVQIARVLPCSHVKEVRDDTTRYMVKRNGGETCTADNRMQHETEKYSGRA